MKFTFISALCLMSIVCLAQNQTGSTTQRTSTARTGKPVSFGIKAGMNVSNLDDNQTGATDALIGYHAGVLAHIHLNTMLALQPEINYSLQGAKYTELGKEKIGYVNVPILLQYMFDGGARLQTGPQIGFVTSAKLERSSGGTFDVKDQIENADVSWVIGLGYISNTGLGVDARYNLGLINIVNDDQHNVKNRVWQFGLFYQFNR